MAQDRGVENSKIVKLTRDGASLYGDGGIAQCRRVDYPTGGNIGSTSEGLPGDQRSL